LRKNIRLEATALAGLLSAALITAPWLTLLGISILYLALIPLGVASYAKVKRLRD
jgi:CDP-diacylglycerol--serine O-phosphatidyltransferase